MTLKKNFLRILMPPLDSNGLYGISIRKILRVIPLLSSFETNSLLFDQGIGSNFNTIELDEDKFKLDPSNELMIKQIVKSSKSCD